MSKRGRKHQAQRVMRQQIASRENRLYYHVGNEWKTDSTANAMGFRRRPTDEFAGESSLKSPEQSRQERDKRIEAAL